MTLSPHLNVRVQAPAGGQDQFGSTLQAPLQPSPASVLPSSHCSMPPWLLMPSPQPGGTGNVPPVPVAEPPVVPPIVNPPRPAGLVPPLPGLDDAPLPPLP